MKASITALLLTLPLAAHAAEPPPYGDFGRGYQSQTLEETRRFLQIVPHRYSYQPVTNPPADGMNYWQYRAASGRYPRGSSPWKPLPEGCACPTPWPSVYGC